MFSRSRAIALLPLLLTPSLAQLNFNFTIANGQIYTPGFAILNAPQPGTPLGGGMFPPLFNRTSSRLTHIQTRWKSPWTSPPTAACPSPPIPPTLPQPYTTSPSSSPATPPAATSPSPTMPCSKSQARPSSTSASPGPTASSATASPPPSTAREACTTYALLPFPVPPYH